MEHPEVPLEQSQEEIAHHAHHATEKWILGVALTAAFLAVLGGNHLSDGRASRQRSHARPDS